VTQLYAVSAAADVFTTVPTLSVTPKFSEFPLPTKSAGPYGIAVGPDGALWFAEAFTASVGRITTAGKISEKVVFSPAKDYELAPDFIATGSDGALWYTTEFNGVIGRVTTSGVPSQFEINKKSSEPTGIAAGPDGALWFTDPFFEPKIGRITTAGVITEYKLPAPDGGAAGIVTGPDGALWFTDTKNNAIGRVSLF
jgi:virginiamycin B lyase